MTRALPMPGLWVEARCASVASAQSANWVRPDGCHETARDGGFFAHMRRAQKHFLRQGWEVIDGEWWCPVCAKVRRAG